MSDCRGCRHVHYGRFRRKNSKAWGLGCTTRRWIHGWLHDKPSTLRIFPAAAFDGFSPLRCPTVEDCQAQKSIPATQHQNTWEEDLSNRDTAGVDPQRCLTAPATHHQQREKHRGADDLANGNSTGCCQHRRLTMNECRHQFWIVFHDSFNVHTTGQTAASGAGATVANESAAQTETCLLYTSPSPRD